MIFSSWLFFSVMIGYVVVVDSVLVAPQNSFSSLTFVLRSVKPIIVVVICSLLYEVINIVTQFWYSIHISSLWRWLSIVLVYRVSLICIVLLTDPTFAEYSLSACVSVRGGVRRGIVNLVSTMS